MTRTRYKRLSPFFLLGLGVAFVISFKVFWIPGVYGFDLNDDVLHTFVNLKAARESILAGEWPMMNCLNHFGTPIIGDALTFPLAPHSLTYCFLPDYLAMTVNRMVIACLTCLVLGWFYRKSMSVFSAILCTAAAMGNGGFIHHFAHHHYQSSLFWMMLTLNLTDRYWVSRTWGRYLAVQGSLIGLWMSTNLNVAGIMTLLWAGWHLAGDPGRDRIRHLTAWILMAILFVLPDLTLFLSQIVNSARSAFIYSRHEKGSEVILALLGGSPVIQHDYLLFIPVAAPWLGLTLFECFRKQEEDGSKAPFRQVFWFGLLPTAGVGLMVLVPIFWKSIPGLRSTDVTRILWGSVPLLLVFPGRQLDQLTKQGWRKIQGWAWISFLILFLVFQAVYLGWSHRLIAYGTISLGLVGLGCWQLLRTSQIRMMGVGRYAMGLLLLLSSWVNAVYLVGLNDLSKVRNTHFFSRKEHAGVLYPAMIPFLKPNLRVGSDEPSLVGEDIRMMLCGSACTSARGIILDPPLASYLIDRDVVWVDDLPLAYHLRENVSAETLHRLGIRYWMTFHRPDALIRSGWVELINLAFQRSAFSKGQKESLQMGLWESPLKITPVYFAPDDSDVLSLPADSLQYLEENQLHWSPRELEVDLPTGNHFPILVVTLSARTGWKATVDGRPMEWLPVADGLMHLKLPSNARKVVIRYEPFTGFQVAGCMGISLLFSLAAWRGLSMQNRRIK